MLINLQHVYIATMPGPSVVTLAQFFGCRALAVGDDLDELRAECERLLDASHRETMDAVEDSHGQELQRLRDRFAELKAPPCIELPGEVRSE